MNKKKTHRVEQKQGETINSGYVFRITLVAALGGLLFGYDTAVISGAIGLLQFHFELTPAATGWAASSALVGCMIGVAIAGLLSDRFGRKKTLVLAGIFFFISAFGTALPETFNQFIVFRILGGIGVGAASIAAPMYIAEISPAPIRGKMVTINQVAIIFGMFVVYFVNYFIASLGDITWNETTGWRWMFASEALPAALMLFTMLFVPETPRWLTQQRRTDEATNILTRIVGAREASEQIRGIREIITLEESVSVRELFEPGLRRVLFIGIILAILQQVTGINVFLYYAPEIFRGLGATIDASLLQTVVVGGVNLSFTVLAVVLIDKAGRKPMLIAGAAGMGISLTALGFASYIEVIDSWALIFILGYIACFALSMGPVTWVVLSEIFPNRLRGRAMGIAAFFLWIANFTVSQTFPMLSEHPWLAERFNQAFPFWLYAMMCGITILFIRFFIPETKGKTLEEIEKMWYKTS